MPQRRRRAKRPLLQAETAQWLLQLLLVRVLMGSTGKRIFGMSVQQTAWKATLA